MAEAPGTRHLTSNHELAQLVVGGATHRTGLEKPAGDPRQGPVSHRSHWGPGVGAPPIDTNQIFDSIKFLLFFRSAERDPMGQSSRQMAALCDGGNDSSSDDKIALSPTPIKPLTEFMQAKLLPVMFALQLDVMYTTVVNLKLP